MILSILKLLFKLLPAVLEGVRRWDAERNAKLVVEEAERSVEREIAQRGYDAAMAQYVELKAKDDLLKAEIARLEGR